MKMGREKMNKRTFMQMRCIFVLLVCVICAAFPASAEDGLVGLWRYEYNDNITFFNLTADNNYEMVITSYPHISTLTGKYTVSGSEIVMTETVSASERVGDFSYIYKIYGDLAMFGDYRYFRVAQEDAVALLADPFLIYNRTVTLSEREALELLFDFAEPDKSDMVEIELYYSYEHYDYVFRRKWPANDYAPERLSNIFGYSFNSLSPNEEYYIFKFYEFVQDDEETGHTATYNFYAVHRNTGEIVQERDYEDPGIFNEDFPW